MEVLNKPEPKTPFEYFRLTEEGYAYRRIGAEQLKMNKVAVVILAGGQGSRLGTDAPKGCFMLSINKTLFQIHCENIKNIMRLFDCTIPIIIMTSSYTHDMILEYFKIMDYFGIEENLYYFIKQSDNMCFDFGDQPLRSENGDIAMAPNGNGSVFYTLSENEIFSKIPEVDFYNIISVDNALARIADPIFIGFICENNLECGSKTVTKFPNESVGVFIKKGDNLLVKEYSEIKNNVIQGRQNDMGKLVDMSEVKSDEIDHSNCIDISIFDQGNICNHIFTKDFLMKVAHVNLPVHKAYKKIPLKHGDKYIKPEKENGYKCELFIFDVFEFSTKNGIMNVPRELEFSPVKNGLDCDVDNPVTAVDDLYRRSKIMLNLNDVDIRNKKIMVWPSASVFGENLSQYRDKPLEDNFEIK